MKNIIKPTLHAEILPILAYNSLPRSCKIICQLESLLQTISFTLIGRSSVIVYYSVYHLQNISTISNLQAHNFISRDLQQFYLFYLFLLGGGNPEARYRPPGPIHSPYLIATSIHQLSGKLDCDVWNCNIRLYFQSSICCRFPYNMVCFICLFRPSMVHHIVHRIPLP